MTSITPRIQPQSRRARIRIGHFEFLLGRFVSGLSWQQMLAEYYRLRR